MKVHQRNLPHIVIIGGGFGGLSAAKALRKADVRITLLDRQNHHLFQPLLYQVATAALSPADIAHPLRAILKKQTNCEVIMTNVLAVDPAAKVVKTTDGEVKFDFLIIAAGARHSYFGHAEWEKHAPGLKTLDDALEIRRRMLLAFEIAEKTKDEAERKAAMTFIVVGGGPTGVEMAGAIAEIARRTLVRDFRHIDPKHAKVYLVEGGERVLSVYIPELSEAARQQLYEIGVDVRTHAIVEKVTESGVLLKGGDEIRSKTIVWAAGNAASPLGESLGVPLDRQGRVNVEPDLSIPGNPEIFVIGDMANFTTDDGKSLPALGAVAMQQGDHVAENIQRKLAGGWTKKFEYWDKGTMATIGRHRAVADVGFLRFSGWAAWLAWLGLHLVLLIGFRNRFSVMINWAWQYFTYGRSARLITGWEAKSEPVQLQETGERTAAVAESAAGVEEAVRKGTKRRKTV